MRSNDYEEGEVHLEDVQKKPKIYGLISQLIYNIAN